MSILTMEEFAIYFPQISLPAPAAGAAILLAQMMAESNLGANRPLELSQYKEVIDIKAGRGHLTRLPIAPLSLFFLEAREGGIRDGLGRHQTRSCWFPLVGDDYVVDHETGEINLTRGTSFSITQIRATYTTGFDFLVDTPDTRAIKSALAAIVNYTQSNSFSGLQEVSIEGEYKVRYASPGSGNGTIPDALLMPFKKYRPRSFC